jgi:hypothetical protein
MIYVFRCSKCERAIEVQLAMKDRHQTMACPRRRCSGVCSIDAGAAAPAIHTSGPPRGDKRIITDERQVIADRGVRWRDEGTTGLPGGIGRKTIYH